MCLECYPTSLKHTVKVTFIGVFFRRTIKVELGIRFVARLAFYSTNNDALLAEKYVKKVRIFLPSLFFLF